MQKLEAEAKKGGGTNHTSKEKKTRFRPPFLGGVWH
jgi:hypothetical protein